MLKEKRVIRDPIHGYIHIDDELIWNLINTREFQRLRRIRQLGSTSVVFPSGTHTRHLHSLGCYEVARRMLEEVKNLGECLNEREKRAVLAAALLHDVGHAPFSHSFEAILKCRHEFYTVQIIRGPSEVNDVLNSVDDSFAAEVAQILEHSHPNKILSQIISSQLDADRLDYLLRDSYCTGTIYGKVDLDRILRTMRVRDNVLAVKQSSIYTVENYIMSRYHMYWQVYYHPTSRSFDSILKSLFLRLKDLYEENHDIVKEYPMYKALLENEVLNNDDFFLLDDETCSYSFNLMRNSSDPILKDLAVRIMDRHLFDYTSSDNEEELIRNCLRKGYDPRYYVVKDYQRQIPYLPYLGTGNDNIWMLMDNGELRELSEVSSVVGSLTDLNEQDERIFYPKEIMK